MRLSKFFILVFILLFPIFGLANVKNICDVIQAHPSWYKAAVNTQKKWGVPVPVQMAIIQEESHFKADARNPRSTAFGYAQAVNTIWHIYRSDTTQNDKARNTFADATNFIGWYANRLHQQDKISPKNAYDLYLAYHDGSGGYKADIRGKYSPAKSIAQHVQYVANLYKQQLAAC